MNGNDSRYADMPDADIVSLAQSGDNIAMETLLLRYKKMVKRKASRMFIAGGDHDDVIQEGMIGLFKAVREYNPDKQVAFSSFAVYCVLSQITDAVRTASRAKHSALNLSISIQGLSLDEDEDPYNLLDVFIDLSKSDPEKLLISKEEQSSLFDFMETELTGNERDALKLFIEGYSYADIADRLGRTVKSVDSAIQRARAKFESYKKEYIYD